ncbi:MAG: hypothetical protein ACRDRL_13745 [Sciscionella sp.]
MRRELVRESRPSLSHELPSVYSAAGEFPGRRRGVQLRLALLSLGAAVLLVGGAIGVTLLVRGSTNRIAGSPQPPPAVSSVAGASGARVPTPGAQRLSGRTSHAAPAGGRRWGGHISAGFPVGSCFYYRAAAGVSVLEATGCQGEDAVFEVNAVRPKGGDCTSIAEFSRYGVVATDESARAVYCASLAAPAGACVSLERGAAPARVACGSDPQAARVTVVRAGTTASGCAGVPRADVWYADSPGSGRVACVQRG